MSEFNIHKNNLDKEHSPYLKQHAQNPVHWQAWSVDVLEEAKRLNKPVLISIGYSACHWCHVMEHECFEDEEVAQIMNKHFVNIKVDREERPDVDQIYMDAVQIMKQQGGWPLNCFALPDGRPIHGGTYFPKQKWIQLLTSISEVFQNEPKRTEEYAHQLTQSLVQSELIPPIQAVNEFTKEELEELINRWTKTFDVREGGSNRAPKFPLPVNYSFLLNQAVSLKNNQILAHSLLTLEKMQRGGIFDQVGGGFARYSVDVLWKVPHFEKMLYDNGQLLGLFADAYALTKDQEFKRTIEQTVGWMHNELLAPSGGLYAALDADSEGEEGKFYCWSEEELLSLVNKENKWLLDYFEMNNRGFWEDKKYILLRRKSDSQWQKDLNLDSKEFYSIVDDFRQNLLQIRNKRIKPGLDDKIITSWNALALKGLIRSNQVLDSEEAKIISGKILRYFQNEVIQSDGKIWRIINSDGTKIEGFLDDYVFTLSAMLDAYEDSFDDNYLNHSILILEYINTHFKDENSAYYFYTHSNSELISRKIERYDNVLPSSNSEMAKNLLRLGLIYESQDWISQAKEMLHGVKDNMIQYGPSFANWADLHSCFSIGYRLVCIVGESALSVQKEMQKDLIPNTFYCGGAKSSVDVIKSKTPTSGTQIFICSEGQCSAPMQTVEEAKEIILR